MYNEECEAHTEITGLCACEVLQMHTWIIQIRIVLLISYMIAKTIVTIYGVYLININSISQSNKK